MEGMGQARDIPFVFIWNEKQELWEIPGREREREIIGVH